MLEKTLVKSFLRPSNAPLKSPLSRDANTLKMSEIKLNAPSTIDIITAKLDDHALSRLLPLLSHIAMIKSLILLKILDNEAQRLAALFLILSNILAPLPEVK